MCVGCESSIHLYIYIYLFSFISCWTWILLPCIIVYCFCLVPLCKFDARQHLYIYHTAHVKSGRITWCWLHYLQSCEKQAPATCFWHWLGTKLSVVMAAIVHCNHILCDVMRQYEIHQSLCSAYMYLHSSSRSMLRRLFQASCTCHVSSQHLLSLPVIPDWLHDIKIKDVWGR